MNDCAVVPKPSKVADSFNEAEAVADVRRRGLEQFRQTFTRRIPAIVVVLAIQRNENSTP